MTRTCEITGKRPVTGNNVSHANNKTKRRFLPNLHYRRIWVPSQSRWVRLRISASGLRLIGKNGADAVIENLQQVTLTRLANSQTKKKRRLISRRIRSAQKK